MKKFFSFLSLLGLTLASVPFQLEPLSDAEIFYINNVAKTSWKAGRNFEKNELERVKGMLGVNMEKNAVYRSLFVKPKEVLEEVTDLPTNFDARTKWPNCSSLNEIRDQSNCGSCWAFGAVEAITDRICIKTGKSVHLSAEHVMDCCSTCGNGCAGGQPDAVWGFYYDSGIVTGGQYGTHEGCMPYSLPPCNHAGKGQYKPCPQKNVPTPKCHRQCESGYAKSFEQDKHYGKTIYKLRSVAACEQDLVNNGPVTATMRVYSDFVSYKSGVYHHMAGDLMGDHAVKIIGYGVEDGVDYWLAVNSWNTDWGDKGFFKIAKGRDEVGIESGLSAGEPKE